MTPRDTNVHVILRKSKRGSRGTEWWQGMGAEYMPRALRCLPLPTVAGRGPSQDRMGTPAFLPDSIIFFRRKGVFIYMFPQPKDSRYSHGCSHLLQKLTGPATSHGLKYLLVYKNSCSQAAALLNTGDSLQGTVREVGQLSWRAYIYVQRITNYLQYLCAWPCLCLWVYKCHLQRDITPWSRT